VFSFSVFFKERKNQIKEGAHTRSAFGLRMGESGRHSSISYTGKQSNSCERRDPGRRRKKCGKLSNIEGKKRERWRGSEPGVQGGSTEWPELT